MTKKVDSVFKEVLPMVAPKEDTLKFIDSQIDSFLSMANKRIQKFNLAVEPYVGGSYAKGTMVKKGTYDVDIFFRFDSKYPEKDYKKLTKRIIRGNKKISVVHGSRDYFQIRINPWFKLEIVPVKKVKSPKESDNITDLSYSHVKYINKKIKSKKILEEIKIAKAFCHATNTYGAESYIHGFSGYSLELLVYYYKSFEKFLRASLTEKKEKIIVDIEKKYKNKNQILIEMNGSKLLSPIILIDPTYKERNALAALNEETYSKFKLAAKEFLKSPKKEFFFPKPVNLEEVKKRARKEGKDFLYVYSKTSKQKGDIAGTKLLKFNKHLKKEIGKYFEIYDSGFKYLDNQEGKAYFVLKKKEFVLFSGPMENDSKHAKKFKEEHEKVYSEKGKLFAKEKINYTPEKFMVDWIKKNKRKIKEMYISKIKFN